MGIINLLDIQVANLIAAGEVVDRPASAIKEMLENAIDAGSTKVTVEIRAGGVSLMRVTDNGCGMTPDDAKLCIQRHATSKIKTAEDLDGIATLGFRGEALAAISSVSDMRIMTKRNEDKNGCVVVCDRGRVVSCDEIGCPDGTTIIAENLFSNVPARRKFLRRDASETSAVSAVIEKIALSRPDIAITYIADGNVKFATNGDGRLLNVIYTVLGRDFATKVISVDDTTENVSVHGYIGTPENCRATRNGENFFINGRYVRCQTAMAALEQAFSSYMPKEKFPCAVLNITFSPSLVDVNVHPQKLEVKFSNEKPIFNAIYCAVRNSLSSSVPRPEDSGLHMMGTSEALHDELFFKKAESPEEAMRIVTDRESLTKKYEQLVIPREPSKNEDGGTFEVNIPAKESVIADTVMAKKVPVFAEKETAETKKAEISDEDNLIPLPDYKIAGVIFNCYILVEIGEKLLIIDKHAAHERINFEKLKSNMRLDNPPSQKLLLPIEIGFSGAEIETAEQYSEELNGIGFETTDGKMSAYPVGMTLNQAKELLFELVLRLADGNGDIETDRTTYYEKALYQASCKASMKAGKEDLNENIDWVVRKVLTDPKIKYCPHGRPVAIEITKDNFEKRFERK